MATDSCIPSPLLDPIAAGEYLGGSAPVRPATLAEWRVKGKGPRWTKIGRLVRYRQADLDAFIQANLAKGSGLSKGA